MPDAIAETRQTNPEYKEGNATGGIMKLAVSSTRRRLVVASLLWLLLGGTPASSQSLATGREQEPIVMRGEEFPQWVGSANIGHLNLYYYDGSSFVEIPFQIDKRRLIHLNYNTSASDPRDNCEWGYWAEQFAGPLGKADFSSDLFHAQDEIVFLMRDAAAGTQRALTSAWITGTTGTRFEVVILDQLTGAERYVYLFDWASTPQDLNTTDYITWVPDGSIDPCPSSPDACGTADSVTLSDVATNDVRFEGNWILTGYFVQEAGSSGPLGNAIDRLRYRAFPDEDEVKWSNDGDPRFLGVKDGNVRVVRGVQGAKSGQRTTKYEFIYPTMLKTTINFRVHALSSLQQGVDQSKGVRDESASNPLNPSYLWARTRFESVEQPKHIDVVDGECAPGTCYPLGYAIDDWTELTTPLRGSYSLLEMNPRPFSAASTSPRYLDNHIPEDRDQSRYGFHERRWTDLACTDDGIDDTPLPGNAGGCVDPEDPELLFGRGERVFFPASSRSPANDPADVRAGDLTSSAAMPLTATANRQLQSGGGGPSCTPLQPSLTATDLNDGGVEVGVAVGAGGCSNFRLFRADGPTEPFAMLGTGDGSSYLDYSTRHGGTYRYKAKSFDSENTESAYSAEVTSNPTDTTPPPSPTIDSATAGSGSVSLEMTGECASDAAGLNVYLSQTSGGPYTKLNSTPLSLSQSPISWQQSGLQPGTTYYFVATLVDFVGNESAYSPEVSATPGS